MRGEWDDFFLLFSICTACMVLLVSFAFFPLPLFSQHRCFIPRFRILLIPLILWLFSISFHNLSKKKKKKRSKHIILSSCIVEHQAFFLASS